MAARLSFRDLTERVGEALLLRIASHSMLSTIYRSCSLPELSPCSMHEGASPAQAGPDAVGKSLQLDIKFHSRIILGLIVHVGLTFW